jgi:DMSO/TMAO reductase YedYZ molybdopterin-dependent catalytic subunit
VAGGAGVTLPPGQRQVEGFPRFGTHFHAPPPAIPADPAIEISGALTRSPRVPLSELSSLPRRELTADFHCVAGWSAVDLRWEGVAFATFYRAVIEPLRFERAVTHLSFRGLDGYRANVSIEDALADDVLIADRLDGRPLGPDHGAPVRVVSPSQYGFVSVKHLCGIELHAAEPAARYHPAWRVRVGLGLVRPHERARVWREERHRHLPAWLVRPVYRGLIQPIAWLSGRDQRR